MPENATAQQTHELAAIMFSDIAAYTALMGRDEHAAMRALDAHRGTLRSILPKYNGRLIGEIGDGTLSSFHSAIDAVSCAREVQDLAENTPELKLRVGIHLGDVVFTNNTVVGDGVNVASRIHALAPPGGICISEHVYDEIRNKPDMYAEYLGQKRLKNVSRAIGVYALTSAGGAVRAGRASKLTEHAVPALIIGALVVLAAFAMHRVYGQRIVAAWRIYVPRMVPQAVEQNVAFCTTSDGVRIAYATSGKGPPLVFVQGWATHIEQGDYSPVYFGDALKELGKHFFVVRFDGRGFGMSDRDIHDFSLEARVRDLEAVADALRLNGMILWAVSAGGQPAIAYAARHPERVSRLLLQDPFARLIRTPQDRQKWDAMVTLIRTGWGSDNPVYRQMFTSLFMPDGSEADQRVFNEMQRISSTQEDAAGFVSAILDIDVRALAPKVRAPTLIIQVRDDQIAPFENGRELAALIPDARLVVLKGRDHVFVNGDGELQQFLEAVTPFLTEAAKPAGRR